jgi:hypothetical protein
MIRTKIYFAPGDQVRRMKIDSNTSFDDMMNQLTKLHETSPRFMIGEYVYQVMYQDEEGDWVIIDSEEEWKDALSTQVKTSDQQLMRIKFIAINKSLEAINKCRKNCQKVVTERYESNVKPMIDQFKELLKDPQKHQQAVEWLKEVTSKLGNQAQTGFNGVHNKVDTWLKTNEVPSKVESYMKEFEQMANTLADRVEEAISNTLAPQDDDEEEEQVIEVIHPMEESHIQLHDHDDDEIIEEEQVAPPQPVEEVVQVEPEKKEQEIEIPREYVEHMRSLDEMGFVDRQMNLTLLQQNKGDLVKTVSALLSLPL